MTNIIDELKWRGAVNQVSDEENLSKLLDEKSVGVYCGTDPTGDSLHVGHLIPFMMLKRFQLAGHRAFILIGGGTGSIGDPSGRSTERTLQTMEQVHHNEEALTSQMKKLFGEDNITIVNNYDWLPHISLLDFWRDYGKLFNINTMLNKEVVASRLEVGISFTEFTYQILQAVDFHHLLLENDVQLQIGGADQWGNITAGIDLIHKMEGSDTQAFALTIPLMLKRRRPMNFISSGSIKMIVMLSSISNTSRSLAKKKSKNLPKKLKRNQKSAKHSVVLLKKLLNSFMEKKQFVRLSIFPKLCSPVKSKI